MNKKNNKSLNPKEAINRVANLFPFPAYMSPRHDRRNPYLNIAHTVMRYLQSGSSILDFGSGPCDKTAILQMLGYRCTGWDDLQDDWHKKPGIREKILDFTRACGVDFRLASSEKWPFETESFDMVMIHDVIEHMHNSPKDLLNDLLSLCKPNGYLFITVPNAVNMRKRIHVLTGRSNYPRYDLYYWYPGPWRGHIREYVRDDLTQLADFLGSEVIELRGCDHMLAKVPRSLQWPYLTITDYFDGMKDSWTLLVKRGPAWTPRKSLPEGELHRILGRSTTFKY
jgi:SAM-dependent methyltransferase